MTSTFEDTFCACWFKSFVPIVMLDCMDLVGRADANAAYCDISKALWVEPEVSEL